MISRFGVCLPDRSRGQGYCVGQRRGGAAPKANVLSLTAQMPTREVFLTSGHSRKLQRGNRTIELMHGNRWQLVLSVCPAGMAISALSCLEPEQASSALKILHTKLPPAEWAAMRSNRTVLPSWIVRAMGEVRKYA